MRRHLSAFGWLAAGLLLALGASALASDFGPGPQGAASAARVRALDGTAAAPSITFAADPDTGIFRSGADQLAITAGGTTRGTWSTTGLTITAAARSGWTVVGRA